MKLPNILHFNDHDHKTERERRRRRKETSSSSPVAISISKSKSNCSCNDLQDNTATIPTTTTTTKTTTTNEPIPRRFLPLYFESEKSLLLMDSRSFAIPEGEEYEYECNTCFDDDAGRVEQGPPTHEEEEDDDDDNEKEVLLYLIRHGEAEHNILEKIAMKEARQKSLEDDGLSEDDPVTIQRIDEARKGVLNDENLKDAKLSDLGRQEAEGARDTLQKMIDNDGNHRSSSSNTTTSNNDNDNDNDNDNNNILLQQPNYIMVSPLTRTLETADIIFPDHCDIHVREDLEERRTGKPPDTRSSIGSLGMRKSFARFSMEHLCDTMNNENKNTAIQQVAAVCSALASGNSNNSTSTSASTNSTRNQQQEVFIMQGDLLDRFEKHDFHFSEEDKTELRKRTERLFVLLGETDQKSIAVVTHKGYLRELERGPLGQTDAKEFKNCEIRAYRVTVSMIDHRLVKAERVR